MQPRIAIVEKAKCHPTRCSHECIKFDPINRSGGEGFHIGHDGKATIAEEKVIEAHSICANKCPFHAIKIIRLPAQLDKDPIHQYGQNGFRVFNVPTPIAGQVVGLAGKNGIGKTTVMNIIAGILNPNLGKLDTQPPMEEILAYFKGTQTQRYFEQIRDGQIKFALKPQQINSIPKLFSGTVHSLLQQITKDEQLIQQTAQQLQLNVILDRDISTISGGELQRTAIAATALKSADVYFFDEPTSFLDIYQRLEVAQFIRSLAAKGKAVLVIEHDLIILDAIADTIHIGYGQENAYGVISGPKSTKNGINMYLSGMLPQENVRFRDHAIVFKKGQESFTGVTQKLIEWPQLKKTLGNFSLQTNAGAMHKHEVVGVLGQNGIGKTTFVQMLAGAIKPDQGEVTASINIAYKPQYIDTTSDELVMSYLNDAITHYDLQLIRPLDLKPLFEKELRHLSGGQLQRVTIAKVLSESADLFLMDEPSAYLDAEQRLAVSRVIRDFMTTTGKTALVVDHDLLFIDYLSDRLLVFDGTPGLQGTVSGPFSMQEGMNAFLKQVNITFRRDEETSRPRANKIDSQMDKKQKQDNIWYYV